MYTVTSSLSTYTMLVWYPDTRMVEGTKTAAIKVWQVYGAPVGYSNMIIETQVVAIGEGQLSGLMIPTWGRYHGGRRPSSDDSLHSLTIIPPSALNKQSIMKRYHHRRTTRWGVTARSPMMVTIHDTRFVECRWWNDGWTVKTVVAWRSLASIVVRCLANLTSL